MSSQLSPVKDPVHQCVIHELNEFISYMKLEPRKLVHQHVSQKLRDLICAIDKVLYDYTSWTQGKREACHLIKLGRELKFIKARMIDGKLDGLRYGTIVQRVIKFHKELMDCLQALHRLYQRILAE